ncbi:MAG: recombinase family protein, partial [Clostridia bacterium]|nr:recombinase family protein [Clostridia bacterium]
MSAEIKWNIPKDKIGSGKLAVVYARFSSHSQGEQSIEGQLSEAYKYATAHGYTIVHEYVDRAKSGRSDNREQFQQMLKDTAKKQFDVIILWKVDRFGRNRE